MRAYSICCRAQKLGYATRGVPYVSCSRIFQSRIFQSRIFSAPVWMNRRLVFCLFLCGFWSDLATKFTGSLFPHFPPSAKFCLKSAQISMRYIRKYLPDSLQYRREAFRFLADNETETHATIERVFWEWQLDKSKTSPKFVAKQVFMKSS